MTAAFSSSFKEQAVRKAVGRDPGVTLNDLAQEWGVSCSTVQRWIRESRVHPELKIGSKIEYMKKEKRPEDWSIEERLTIVIACGALDDASISKLCREKGLYRHHVEQWKTDFVEGAPGKGKAAGRTEVRQLKHENKALKKELHRKEKALAETAALLVLQKKVDAMWSDDEGSSL